MANYGLKSFTVGSNTYEINTKNAISINGTAWDGSASAAIYAPTSAGTSGQVLISNGSGAPDWASIPAGVTVTLNGSTTTTPSFYAPTTAGTSGQVLTSSGSGAPTWAAAPAGVTITLNGSATTTPSFYAPTGVGTSGQILTSSGSGAPSWTTGVLTDTQVTVAENATATKYYLMLASGIGTATRQIDTNDQIDADATAAGLWYQNGILGVPGLQVSDIDYSITIDEYDTLWTLIDDLVV